MITRNQRETRYPATFVQRRAVGTPRTTIAKHSLLHDNLLRQDYNRDEFLDSFIVPSMRAITRDKQTNGSSRVSASAYSTIEPVERYIYECYFSL